MTENNLTEDHVRRYPNEDSGFFHAQNHFHAVSLSGGKDSTCLLLLMIERGMPIDAVISADTGMEFPEMYGKAIGGAFIEGFKEGFDTEQITTALKNWASEHKGTVAALGIVLGGKLIGGVAKGVQQARGLVSTIQGILGKGSGAGGMAGAMGGYTTTSMRVTAGVVNVYGNLASNAANAAGAAGRSAMGGLPTLPGGGGTTPALPGGAGGAAAAGGLTSATGWLGRLLQVGSKSSVVGADGTLLAVKGGIGGALGGVGGALGSGATTAAGAAAAGTAAIGGGLLGGAGIISGLIDIFRGTKTSGKEAQTAYATGGSKIGMAGLTTFLVSFLYKPASGASNFILCIAWKILGA